MPDTPVIFSAPPGLALRGRLYDVGNPTTVVNGATGDAAVERTDDGDALKLGLYELTVTEPLTGPHRLHVVESSSGAVIGVFDVSLFDTTEEARAGDFPQPIVDLIEADRFIDTATTPWALVLVKNGSGGLGSGIELLRQQLKDVSSADIDDVNTVIGQMASS